MKMRMLGSLMSSAWSTLATVCITAGMAIVVAVLVLGIGIAGAIAFYFVVWWIVLFVSLPIGTRSQHEDNMVVPGTDPGAPITPRLRERAVLTTFLSDIVFLLAIVLWPLAGL